MKKLVYILSIFAILFVFGSCEKEVIAPINQDQDEYVENLNGNRGGEFVDGDDSVTDPDEDEDFDEEEEDENIVDPDEDEDFDEEERKGGSNPIIVEGK
jgi:hypothetical protein